MDTNLPTFETGRSAQQRAFIEIGIVCLLIVATVLTYLPTLWCGFVNLDDPHYVIDNAAIARGISASGLAYAWTTFDVANWIPLTWMSYELDVQLFGVHAGAFHGVNLAWHTANVLLLYCVLRRLTGARNPSLAVALLFAVHPLHVESVAWISERKDVLSTNALLLTLLFYERYAARPTVGRLACVCMATALGLLAKPMLVTTPCLLLLLDIWPLRRLRSGDADCDSSNIYPRRTIRELLIEKTPLFALSLADGIVTIIAQRSEGAMGGTDNIPFYGRAGNAIEGYAWYLWKTICPTKLCVFYPLPEGGPAWKWVALSSIVLISISVFVIMQRTRGHLVFGWFWFVIALLPVSGLLQVGGQAYADRYAYVPHIGLFTLIVWEGRYWFVRCPGGRWLAPACVGAAVVCSAMLANWQTGTWRNSEALWSRALELDPENYGAHIMLGTLRVNEGNWDAAERHLHRGLVRGGLNFREAIYNLGRIAEQRGNNAQAAEYYAWALRINPQFAAAASRLANLELQRPATAKSDRPAPSRQAVELNRLGLASARRGAMQDAVRHFQEAMALEPEYADAHNNAALALKELRRTDEAKRHFLQAVVLAPENADFHVNLAAVLDSLGDREGAREHYEAALRLRPSDVEVRVLLERMQTKSAVP